MGWLERFHMTSRPPYWWFKLMKRRPCWCSTWVLYVGVEPTFFSCKNCRLIPAINLHSCWPVGENALLSQLLQVEDQPWSVMEIPKKTEAASFSFYLWESGRSLSFCVLSIRNNYLGYRSFNCCSKPSIVSTSAPFRALRTLFWNVKIAGSCGHPKQTSAYRRNEKGVHTENRCKPYARFTQRRAFSGSVHTASP